MTIHYGFVTDRLMVDDWHALKRKPNIELPVVVQSILTPPVTASLPVSWQGPYTYERAQTWIDARDEEGLNLLVSDRSSDEPVGVLVLLEGTSFDLRIGYILKESAWGRGFATELVRGLVEHCRHFRIRKIIAGLSAKNNASKRVLEKSGFSESRRSNDSTELLFELSF